ncbi:MAG TPA: NAD(P)/FAD-dependent oxidoreductase [Candidatus Kapabacteria bacterium]|nr:NAD(P)/FAD-dependent oxidoreductase [Candidatus Kapabacteria bacterium]
MARHITLLGAGLTGPLLATYLARRGYAVDLYERRPDMRLRDVGGGRSINLALSTRGIHALAGAGIDHAVLADAIAMPGRMIHDLDGTQTLQPYGVEGQAINSISRSGLNILLLDAAEREPGVTVHFSARASHVNLERRTVTVVNDETGEERTFGVDLLIAADGANSSLRAAMVGMPGFEHRVEWLEHAYKELEIPPGENGAFLMEPHALHIWPRHDFMMIALPNPNATFTCTLFAPYAGENGFDAITSDADVRAYFERHFPDALPLMPTLIEDWNRNPTSQLGTVFCGPWNVGDWALLIGDAAHAIVPFYGQGMNCCFEDCSVLDGLLAEHGDDWQTVIDRFYELRKPNSDAIARLAVANFLEMRSKVVDPVFQRKRRIEAALHAMFPDRWIPLYTMVTFTTIGYADALRRSREQDELLDRVGLENVERAIAAGSDAARALLGLASEQAAA